MDKIAITANVSKKTLYNNFSSKENLFTIIVEQIIFKMHSLVIPDLDITKSIQEQLLQIANNEIKLLSNQDFIETTRMLMVEGIVNKALMLIIEEQYNNFESNFTNWLKQATLNNMLKIQDYELASKQFFALIKSFAFWPQIALGGSLLSLKEQQQVIKNAVVMFLNTYKA